MPSRKSGSSEEHSNSPRTRTSSLRRFSSLASFSALNPFSSSNRRRSNNATIDSLGTSSTTNLSTIASANPSFIQHHDFALTSSSDPPAPMHPDDDQLTDLPGAVLPTTTFSKRASYICLPDDPIGGMPRSRTFSNLPLPARTRRAGGVASLPVKTHNRGPSAHLPPSRLPSPVTSTRKHSTTRLVPPLASRQRPPSFRANMKRSDTEPLLSIANAQPPSAGRSTAFKENISPGPAKPLPPLSMAGRPGRGSPLLCRVYPTRNAPSSAVTSTLHSGDSHYSSSPPVLGALDTASNMTASTPLKHELPKNDDNGELLPPPPQPAQRWKSQPLLVNATNLHRHEEIKQRRLLSERPPPTPELARNPSFTHAVTTGRLKAAVGIQLRELQSSPTESRASHRENRASPEPRGLEITTSEPAPYWAGRFGALVDRYRNEELAAHLQTITSEASRIHSAEADLKRMLRALEYLHSLCGTSQALHSFVSFQLQLASIKNLPDLAKPLRSPKSIIILDREEREESGPSSPQSASTNIGSISDGRKSTFMDRLLGRGARNRKSVG